MIYINPYVEDQKFTTLKGDKKLLSFIFSAKMLLTVFV